VSELQRQLLIALLKHWIAAYARKRMPSAQRHEEKGSAGFAPRGARNRAAAGGLGASGAAALYCLKQDRDDMVPVGVVENKR
jgi:hypothetical protein